jgi:hypothetical protein
MANLTSLPLKLNSKKYLCRAIIETPKGCRNKFDYEPDSGLFMLGGLLPEGMMFPFDFGFLPSTLGEDGDLSSLTTVTIAGIGTATITDPNAVYSFPAPIGIADGFPVLPYVIFGTLDHSPALDSFTGFGAQGSNALLGYDLTTSIGPITGSPGGVDYPTRTFLHTTLGNLSFTANITPTGAGTFTAIVTPEPMSLLLLGSGITMLAGMSRFRARS